MINKETDVRPDYYKSGELECEEITHLCSFDVGNAIKYVFRAGLKGDEEADLNKALQYINFARMGFSETDLMKLNESELPDWKKHIIWQLIMYAYVMDPECLNDASDSIQERLNDLKR